MAVVVPTADMAALRLCAAAMAHLVDSRPEVATVVATAAVDEATTHRPTERLRTMSVFASSLSDMISVSTTVQKC